MAKNTKKRLNFNENFFASNIFTFNSWSCISEIDKIHPYPAYEAQEILKVYADKNVPIRFAFGSKVGLVRLNDDGSIAESNVLGKLIAINNKSIENYFSFFKRNGFLLPISFDEYESIGKFEIISVINRLHATLELMSTITDMSRTSYEKIVRLIMYLLFAPIVVIETKEGKYSYSSTKHPYTLFLEQSRELSKDPRLNDTFNNLEFKFDDSIYSGTTIEADFIYSTLEGYSKENKYNNDLFRKIFTVYCAPRKNLSKQFLLINDFLFHYFYKVGIIDRVDLDTTHYLNEEVKKENFDESLKKAAIQVAKLLIKEEIDFNLKRVRVAYDISKMEPAWKIDSLLSALYFGLFYMRPSMEIYRRCANPKCNEFFLVSVTSRKKKYCCTACMNRDIQARHRAKQRELD